MGAAIVVGMGMASTLFFLTVSLYGFLDQILRLQRLFNDWMFYLVYMMHI